MSPKLMHAHDFLLPGPLRGLTLNHVLCIQRIAGELNLKMKIGTNTMVAISYTVKDQEGNVLDASSFGQPLVYLHGCGAVIPGIEKALAGCCAGDSLSALKIAAEDAFGVRDPALVKIIPRGALPKDLTPMSGLPMTADDQKVWFITDVGETQITIDANTPLAGQELTVDVRVVDVWPATSAPENPQQTAYDTANTGWDL